MKKKILDILKNLDWTDKAKKNELTKEEWDKIAEAYKTAHGTDFYDDMKKTEADAKTVEEDKKKAASHDAVLALLGDAEGKNAEEKVEAVIAENAALKKTTEEDKPKEIKAEIKVGMLGMAHTTAHAFGIEHELYARSKRHNEVAAVRQISQISATKEDAEIFEKDFASLSRMVMNRYNELHASGQLEIVKSNLLQQDYSQLTNAGLGDQFVIRRIDAIISRILMIPDVTGIFPRRSGIQDRELITNAIFGEFSAAYQGGEVFKGSYKLQPEMGRVEDAMMKTKVGSFKWIERTYLGYLNTNGSDPFKPTMIEWLFINIGTQLRNEQNHRNILGYYIEPTTGEPGSYLNAGPGVIHTLFQYAEDKKMLVFDEVEFSTYNATNFVEVVEGFLGRANSVIPDLGAFELLLNEKHRPWFTASYRKKYGKDLDFTGNTISVPDFSCNIRFVPSMGTLKLMILQTPGNIQLLEFVPGEMFSIYFERRLEELLAMSSWKEGVSASHVGIKFDTKAELMANNFKLQQIFINYPAVHLDADATGIDLTKSLIFVTGENTAATVLDAAELKNATPGLVFKIETGSTADATTITNAGSFNLKSNWTPTAVGNWIKLVYNAKTEKFDEVARSA